MKHKYLLLCCIKEFSTVAMCPYLDFIYMSESRTLEARNINQNQNSTNRHHKTAKYFIWELKPWFWVVFSDPNTLNENFLGTWRSLVNFHRYCIRAYNPLSRFQSLQCKHKLIVWWNTFTAAILPDRALTGGRLYSFETCSTYVANERTSKASIKLEQLFEIVCWMYEYITMSAILQGRIASIQWIFFSFLTHTWLTHHGRSQKLRTFSWHTSLMIIEILTLAPNRDTFERTYIDMSFANFVLGTRVWHLATPVSEWQSLINK